MPTGRKRKYSYSHNKSVELVAKNRVDAAAVDSIVYDFMVATGSPYPAQTKVIHRSPQFGIPPVVVPLGIAPQLKLGMREIFLNMHADPLGREILEEMRIDRFVEVPDSNYDSIRAMRTFIDNNQSALLAGGAQASGSHSAGDGTVYFGVLPRDNPVTTYGQYQPLVDYLTKGTGQKIELRLEKSYQDVVASLGEGRTFFALLGPLTYLDAYKTFWLALAEKLGLKGFGKDGFGAGQDFTRPDDFYIRMVANTALDGKEPVADATPAEIELFKLSRRHLPKNVCDIERWQAIGGPAWPKVFTVLNRGGRFGSQASTYKDDQVANKYGKLINLYQEKTAGCKDAFTGKSFYGMARFVPIADTMGKDTKELAKGYPLHLITQRDVRHTKSRTITMPYLTDLMPENGIIMHTSDAKQIGVKTGDRVKVISATNPNRFWDLKKGRKKPMVGKVQVTETIKPGVITFTLGHGHWSAGAEDVTIEGKVVAADTRRAAGVHANAAMWIDPYLKNTCMIDKVGGSVSFYDTMVQLIKV